VIPQAALPEGPAPNVKVEWRRNQRRRTARTGALFSLSISGALFAMTAVSLALGDRSLLTLFAFVISLFLLDGALSRLFAARKAPTEVGFSQVGLHVRARGREVVAPWGAIADIRFTAVGPRPDTLTVTVRDGQLLQYTSVSPSIGSEAKLAWLEAGTRAREQQRGRGHKAFAPPPSAAPSGLAPSPAPQYWVPRSVEGPRPGYDFAPGRAGPEGAHPLDNSAIEVASRRPEWGYTRSSEGPATPDPGYHSPPSSVKPLVWHFLPPGTTRAGALLLLSLVVLAAIAITRMAADALLPAGNAQYPLTTTFIGLAAGAVLAVAVWRVAKSELAGEVAGSVIFLPAFDRTKGEIVGALRESGAALGAVDATERRLRGRLVVRWRSTRTRATILQAAPDLRAIVLRTEGRAHYDAHSRLKGAILERLEPPPRLKK
jgi:hypothetical protein